MNRLLSEILEALERNPNRIYVWVITAPGAKKNHALRVGYVEAVEWCKEYANGEGKGTVPAYLGTSEVFLGYAPFPGHLSNSKLTL